MICNGIRIPDNKKLLDSKDLFMKSYNSLLACLLFIFSSTVLAADFTLPSGQWRLISLPANPPGQRNTVESVFGDDIGGEYGTKWVLYEFDAETNGYHKLLKSDSVAIGKGYWITQVTGHPVVLDMPAGSTNLLTSSVPLISAGNNQIQWNLLGYPFSVSGNLNDFSVKAAHVNTDDNDLMPCLSSGCPLDMNSLVYDHVWIYDGNSYVDKNMSGSWGIGAELESWDGFWVAVQNNKGYDLSLNARHPKTEISSVDASVMDGKNIMLTMTGRFPKDNHQGFFIDSDNNPNTGYVGGFKEIHGADYLLQENGLHKYPENAQGWRWDRVTSEARIVGTSITGIRSRASTNYFPLSLLSVENTFRFTAVTTTSDWSKNYYYPQMKEYQIGGIESPSGTPIVIIGPSTVHIVNEVDRETYKDGSECALEGWGEVFPELAKKSEAIFNYARAGSSAASFLISPERVNGKFLLLYGPNRDHYWGKTKEKMQELNKGILLIQFGGNDNGHLQAKYPFHEDGNKNKPIVDYNKDGVGDPADNITRWEIIYNEFQKNVKFYIDEAKALNFTPILITSPNARELVGGKIANGRLDFPLKMKELGQREGVRVLDLHQKTLSEYNAYIKTHTYKELNVKFGNCYKRGGMKDYVHFEIQGARTVARWIKDMACEGGSDELCKQLK
jgi:lysophospholipase L1-like esterase